MAINNISGRITNSPATPRATNPVTGKEAPTSASPVDKTNLPIIDRLKAAFAASSEAPVNSERIATLKQAISEGQYKIDAGRVAKKIMQFENATSEQ